MRFIELKYNGKIISNEKVIIDTLFSKEFYWLIDSEIYAAKIEILNNTIIWNGGDYLYGNWHYGIFRNGNFYGNWENGIFEDGNFNGVWISGVMKNKK
jgi:hypothetical protein